MARFSLNFNSATFVEQRTDADIVVEGVLTWKNPNSIPEVGTTSATWVFTPNGEEYFSLEGTIAIVVNPIIGSVENKTDSEGYATKYIYKGTAISTPTKENFVTNNENAEFTFTWYEGSEVDESKKITAEPVNVGNYVLVVKVMGNVHYTETELKLIVTIVETTSGNGSITEDGSSSSTGSEIGNGSSSSTGSGIGNGSSSSTGSTSENENVSTDNTTKTEIKEDGTKVEITVEDKEDGTKIETITEIKVDGTKTETVTETKIDGTKTETITATSTDGSTKVAITKTNSDGSVKEVITKTEANGSSIKTTVTKNAAGELTSSKVTIKDFGTQKANSENVKYKITKDLMEQISKNLSGEDTKATIVVLDDKKEILYKIVVNTEDMKVGNKLYICAQNSKTGEYTLVNKKVYKVSKNGNVNKSKLKKWSN